MGKVVRNTWAPHGAAPIDRAHILSRDSSPEGLDVQRLRFRDRAVLDLDPALAHVVGVIRGRAVLDAPSTGPLALERGCHLFVPLGERATLRAEPGFEIAHVASPKARGTRVLLRDETFVRACADEAQPLRWILTPQYLSRRIFLHHDHTLLSRRGHPVSWFHTTMFDVAGLPTNDEGEPVFKMAYTSRTEFNVCYDVTGHARVRMSGSDGAWGPWQTLDGESTYHLDEAPEADGKVRNKHEISAVGGYVTLFCAFDPAPTGIERHRPGEYSDYEPFHVVAERPEHAAHQARIGRYDEMVDTLSLAKARGELDSRKNDALWQLYEAGRAAQRMQEEGLIASARDRASVLASWISTDDE
ncbi:MAG: hypothetical protein JNL21_30415 [Myxococcales bacterium]|nr:hypothetical protein [Myxococcales bacterium]